MQIRRKSSYINRWILGAAISWMARTMTNMSVLEIMVFAGFIAYFFLGFLDFFYDLEPADEVVVP